MPILIISTFQKWTNKNFFWIFSFKNFAISKIVCIFALELQTKHNFSNMATNNASDVHTLDTSSFVATESPKTIKQKILSGLKMVKSDKRFIGTNVPLAHESYLMSKYGAIQNNEKRVDNFMDEISNKISSRSMQHKYMLVEEIPWDIIEFKDVIIKFFQDKGYIAHDMSDLIEGMIRHYIFLCWDNFHLALDSINLEENS